MSEKKRIKRDRQKKKNYCKEEERKMKNICQFCSTAHRLCHLQYMYVEVSVCSVCCPMQHVISFIRYNREGVWPGLVHYKSYPVNPGRQEGDQRLSSQDETGQIVDTRPPGGDVEKENENAIKLYTVCCSLIQSDRRVDNGAVLCRGDPRQQPSFPESVA